MIYNTQNEELDAKQLLTEIVRMHGAVRRTNKHSIEMCEQLAKVADTEKERAEALETDNRRLREAIQSCLDWAHGRESEWGERAVTAFGFLRAALASTAEAPSPESGDKPASPEITDTARLDWCIEREAAVARVKTQPHPGVESYAYGYCVAGFACGNYPMATGRDAIDAAIRAESERSADS